MSKHEIWMSAGVRRDILLKASETEPAARLALARIDAAEAKRQRKAAKRVQT